MVPGLTLTRLGFMPTTLTFSATDRAIHSLLRYKEADYREDLLPSIPTGTAYFVNIGASQFLAERVATDASQCLRVTPLKTDWTSWHCPSLERPISRYCVGEKAYMAL